MILKVQETTLSSLTLIPSGPAQWVGIKLSSLIDDRKNDIDDDFLDLEFDVDP